MQISSGGLIDVLLEFGFFFGILLGANRGVEHGDFMRIACLCDLQEKLLLLGQRRLGSRMVDAVSWFVICSRAGAYDISISQ